MRYSAYNKRTPRSRVAVRRSAFFAAVAKQLLMTALFVSTSPVFAQQLSVRHYNVEDGLPHSIVGAIYQDGNGYIWMGTADGLSRFDGYRFTNYGKADGLPSAVVTSITEDEKGELWIGTTGGIARLIDDPNEMVAGQASSPGGRKKFVSYQIGTTDDSNAVNTILFDKSGALWCTSDEIYRAMPDATRKLKFEIAITHKKWTSFRAFADSRGRLWFGLQRELIEYVDGQVVRYGPADGLPMEQSYSREAPIIFNEQIVAIAENSQGRIFVANRRNLFEFIDADTNVQPRGHWRRLPLELPLDREIFSLAIDAQQRFLIGTTKGLIRYDASDDGQMMSETLTGASVIALFQDHAGNLWASARDDGVYKSSGDFIVSFTKTEGMPGQGQRSIIEGPAGTIYAASSSSGVVEITNGKVQAISASQSFSLSHFISFLKRDSRGNYWVATRNGLYYSRGPELDFRHGVKFGSANGAPPIKQFGIGWYEDPNGRIWCGAGGDPALYVLAANNTGKQTFERIPLETTPKGHALNVLHDAISDRSGEIWFGWQADLGRYQNGRLELIEPNAPVDITPRTFFIDSRGWLWIGTAGSGVLMTTDPTAAHPQFVSYTVSNGLINDTVGHIVEDEFGRIYFSTPKGLDRLDVDTERVHHFTMADGMGGASAGFSLKDREGNIWVASGNGVTKLNPRLERPASSPPPVYFNHVQIAGEDLPLQERGAQRIELPELPASRNNLLIEFIGVDFQGEHQLRYQYKLEGVDKDWSAPSEQRLLNFARLAPGSYRLLVRSLNAEGSTNDSPSMIEFRILPPLWQRWWFISLVVLAIALLLFFAYRYRIARLMELDRTRLRIARDLHDEVGSGLGSIGILSELAAEDEVGETQRKALAGKIATASRELGNMLGEIVWALRQESEALESFAYHLTERANRLFPSALPEFSTDFPLAWPDVKLSLPVRRNLQLIALEALHNAARHSQATKVTLRLAPAGRRWQLTVADDGIGLHDGGDGTRLGMGLTNMQRRAAEVGAQIEFDSTIDKGIKVTVVFDPQAKEKT
jgi:ligand-binding sensor domain-containing protein/signal transduction histidine kinase